MAAEIGLSLIDDAIEVFIEMWSDGECYTADRLRFHKVTHSFYKPDRTGDGLMTITIKQARDLKAKLDRILKERGINESS